MTLTEYLKETDLTILGEAKVVLSNDEFKIRDVRKIPRLGHIYAIYIPKIDGVYYAYDNMTSLYTTCNPDDEKRHSCFWLPCNANEVLKKITKKEIGTLAFVKLRKDGNKDAALRLAAHLIDGKGISLGISDLDWEIQNAIEYCTNCDKLPYSTNDRGWIYFSFVGEVEISQAQEEKNRIEFYD